MDFSKEIEMKVLVIQNCDTEGIGSYEQHLLDNKINYDIIHVNRDEKFPPLKHYDFFIVGGTPISVNEIKKHDFLLKEWNYLKEVVSSNKPYLGICFGAQLLAKLMGANVRRNPIREIGGYEVELTSVGKKDSVFHGFPSRFPVFQWHADTFDLPIGAKLLAKGKDCFNQAFRFRKALALQFHLEINSEEAKKWAHAYREELDSVNKSIQQVVSECKSREHRMNNLSYQLLNNYFRYVI